jgi:L-malate glycosyltransferase
LHENGYEVETLTSAHSDGFLSDVPGVKKKLFYRRSENKFVTLFFFLVSQVFIFLKCFSYLNKDVVFHVNTMMPFGAAFAAWVMRKKVVYHIHETSIKPLLLKKVLRFFVKLTADHVIYVSEFLTSAEYFQDKDIFVLHNSVSSIPDEVSKRSYPEFNILMVCSLKKYKGIDEFVKLARRFEGLGSHFTFTLVLNATQDEIALYFKNSLPGNIEIYSRQADVSPFYKKANVLLSLSRPEECVETYGLTIVEAMSYSVPVIAPPVGGPAEIITDGVQGFLISCYELEEIKRRICEMYADKNFYNCLKTNARSRALDFSSEEFDQNIVSFYAEKVIR